jgi:predicted glycogen debranching enzyme
MDLRDQDEWLETDGLGGFASGTASGIRTRRYHGLLLSAVTPPTQRYMLVNGVEVSVKTDDGVFALSTQRYEGDVVQPEGYRFIEHFDAEPWPTWRFKLPDGTRIEQELFLCHGEPTLAICWRLVGDVRGAVSLSVRPLVSGRDYHALHHENPNFRFEAEQIDDQVRWQPYPGAAELPAVVAHSNGRYAHGPLWYRQFLYQEERQRGFDATEDLASPGAFTYDLSDQDAVLILSTSSTGSSDRSSKSALQRAKSLRLAESRRRLAFPSPLHRAADQYIVKRGEGRSIIAGYPWFADWGRDTFVSIRGLCIASRRFADAADILLAWSQHVSRGMLPNRFPDRGREPEYNSVDASLWYVVAVLEFLKAAENAGHFVPGSHRNKLLRAVQEILHGYAVGTRHGIGLDSDGLIAAGEPGVQLTWMDARVGDRVITPRWGKPVEVQALWLNALALASEILPEWESVGVHGAASFRQKFWNRKTGCLYDTIDCNGEPGAVDTSCRPNQIFAVGGLPLVLLESSQARSVVDAVESRLWTPLGIRSLSPHEPGYAERYIGGPAERDAVYHQGTVWPWLAGPFVEAWVRVRGMSADAKRVARKRFIEPLRAQLQNAGIGHLSEIADAESPHATRGCPFQAWSLAELIRLEESVLLELPLQRAAPTRRSIPATTLLQT